MNQASIFEKYTRIDRKEGEEGETDLKYIYESNETFYDVTNKEMLNSKFIYDVQEFYQYYKNNNFVEQVNCREFTYELCIKKLYDDYKIYVNRFYSEMREDRLIEEIDDVSEDDQIINEPYTTHIEITFHNILNNNREENEREVEEENPVLYQINRINLFPRTTASHPIREDQCVVCYDVAPNVLYPVCKHIVVCRNCDEEGNFQACPICRTSIRQAFII